MEQKKHGGIRIGSGRKPLAEKTKVISFRVKKSEIDAIKAFVKSVREEVAKQESPGN